MNRPVIERSVVTVFATAFEVYLAKGNLGWLPNWVIYAIWVLCGFYWLFLSKAVQIFAKEIFGFGEKPSPLVLPVSLERKSKVRKKTLILAVSCLGLSVFIGFLGVYLRKRWNAPLAPAAPQIISTSVEFGMNTFEGKIVRLSDSAVPCSKSKFGIGLKALQDLPGGSQSKKPILVLQGRKFLVEDTFSKKYLDVAFDVEITNRGEASIAKGWLLCLTHGGNEKPQYYEIEKNTDTPDTFDELVFRSPIEHAHATEGWVRFRIPRNFYNFEKPIFGTLECRDYLERRVAFNFAVQSQPIKSLKP